MCGEKRLRKTYKKQLRGSPPHVRGKETLLADDARIVRITPACAGKSFGRPQSVSLPQDHPRMCGEKDLLQVLGHAVQGSPPHVRGKVTHCSNPECGEGITPACAGKSVHAGRDRAARPGSPPHVRGKALLPPAKLRARRITPACAGKRHLAGS